MRRSSARTVPTALATIVLPVLMVMLTATPAAAATPTIVVAAGFDFPEIAACTPDGNGATIPLKIAAAQGATLTGASSNPTLLPAAGITFNTTGGVRSVTLATVPGQIGQADVTLTVSDGAGTATVVIHTIAFGDGRDGTNPVPAIGTLDDDLMLGRGGDDHLIGGIDNKAPADGGPTTSTGRDTLCGGVGNDHLEGQDQEDTVDGQTGDDLVKGAQGNDIVRGGDGNDQISGRGGADFYSCGTDTVPGDGSGDIYYGYRANPTNGALPDTSDGSCDDATNGSHK